MNYVPPVDVDVDEEYDEQPVLTDAEKLAILREVLEKWQSNHELEKTLYGSCGTGNMDVLQSCVQSGLTQRQLNRGMLRAAQLGNDECVQFLLDHGADIDVCDTSDENTALMLATYCGHLKVAKLLVARNCDLNKQSYKGMTALHIAAFNGNDRIARCIIQSDRPVSVDLQDCYGDSPVTIAARKGFPRVIRQLIFAHANFDHVNREAMSALHYAAKTGNTECVQYLVKWGASLALRNLWGYTALMSACEAGQLATMKQLVDAGSLPDVVCRYKRSLVHMAVKTNRLEILRYLLTERSLSPENFDDEQHTPLLDAIHSQRYQIMFELIYAGVDVNRSGRVFLISQTETATALDTALVIGDQLIVRALVAVGATKWTPTKFGNRIAEKLLADQRFLSWFLVSVERPPSLSCLARECLRRALGARLQPVLADTALAAHWCCTAAVRDFLAFNDFKRLYEHFIH